MNILILTNQIEPVNGWATVGFYLAKELARNHSVSTIAAADYKIPIHSFTRNAFARNDHLRLVQSDLGEKYDIILCVVETLLPLAAKIKSSRKVPRLVLLGQGTYAYTPFVRGLARWINRWIAKAVDHMVVPSAYTKGRVAEWWPNELTVIPYGVDCDLFYPIASEKELAFISVGAQKERKGTGSLLEAMALISKDYDVKLYLVGPQNFDYVNMSRQLNIGEKVIFTGSVSHDELIRLYSRCLAHALPSVNARYAFEGFGLVHLEANACGIPSIGSAGTANEEVILDGKNGFLCPQQNAPALADKMTYFLKNKEGYAQMCLDSINYARAHSWSRTASLIEKLLS